MEKFHLKNAETKTVDFYLPSLIYFLLPWKSLLSKMSVPKTVGGLSSGAGAALWRSRGCLDASSLVLVAAEVAAPVLGTRATFILGPHHPPVPAGEIAAAWASPAPGGWRGYGQRAGMGPGRWWRERVRNDRGHFWGGGAQALSACYRAAICRAEIWQSVNTSSQTTRRMNLGPT